jgi:hypothetical protein
MQNLTIKYCSTKYASGIQARSVKTVLMPVMVTALAVIVSACASTPAPTEQVAVSTAAVANATTAGAPELASAEMQLARQKLDRAKVAMIAEDYKLARSLSEEAQVDAQLAEAKALSGKAHKAADELQESVRVLREEIDRKAK